VSRRREEKREGERKLELWVWGGAVGRALRVCVCFFIYVGGKPCIMRRARRKVE